MIGGFPAIDRVLRVHGVHICPPVITSVIVYVESIRTSLRIVL